MDIDNLPIGVKPTNKMPFEQLIEEKLRIQNELDQEQARYGRSASRKAAATRPTPLVKKRPSSLSTSSLPAAVVTATIITPQQTTTTRTSTGSAINISIPQTSSTNTTSGVSPRSNSSFPFEQFEQDSSAQKVIQPKKYLKKGEGLQR